MADKPSFDDLFKVTAKYVDYLIERSHLSHQYLKNVSDSGAVVERELRALFSNLLPNRYQVVHGYIAAASDINDNVKVSPQVDMIVVDTTIPHSIYVLDGDSQMEVVPFESVVAICELKRAMDKSSLISTKKKRGALEQLQKIVDDVGLTKTSTDRYLAGGMKLGNMLSGGYCNNPMVAIITATHTKNLHKISKGNPVAGHIDNIIDFAKTNGYFNYVDLLASLDGFINAPTNPSSPQDFLLENPRGDDVQYRIIHAPNQSRNYILARTLGYILAYIQSCTGRNMKPDAYFFNTALDNL